MVERYRQGEFLIHPPKLSGNRTSCHVVANQQELAKEIMNLAHEISVLCFEGFFNIP
jgi:hypothetical protein